MNILEKFPEIEKPDVICGIDIEKTTFLSEGGRNEPMLSSVDTLSASYKVLSFFYTNKSIHSFGEADIFSLIIYPEYPNISHFILFKDGLGKVDPKNEKLKKIDTGYKHVKPKDPDPFDKGIPESYDRAAELFGVSKECMILIDDDLHNRVAAQPVNGKKCIAIDPHDKGQMDELPEIVEHKAGKRQPA